jgi:ppGpp synthetase/RelA/SpoT-type nucleotidyltranferase
MLPIKNKLLFIDDDFRDNLDAFNEYASVLGYEIIGINNVEDGIAFLKTNDSVCAIILDMGFPVGQKQGYDAISEIKLIDSLVPIIMLTGSDSAADINKAIECINKGASDYILKGSGFSPKYLFDRVNTAIKKYFNDLEDKRHLELKEEFKNRLHIYEWMLQVTEMIIKNVLADKLMFTPVIEKRVKEFKSFYKKIVDKESKEGYIENPFKRFSDLAGLSVIFFNNQDLNTAAELLSNSNDFLDWRSKTQLKQDEKYESYGYKAIHFDTILNPEKRMTLDEYQILSDVPCEIQLKTIFAHSWSKIYHALSYKEKEEMKLSQQKKDEMERELGFAAKSLEQVEVHISKICKDFFIAKKSTNAN